MRSIFASIKTFWKSLNNGWCVRWSTSQSLNRHFFSLFNNIFIETALALRICYLVPKTNYFKNKKLPLFNNLFKVQKFTRIQFTYIHKNSQTNRLIKVNYPILQTSKKSSNLLIKKKEIKKCRFVTYHKISYTQPTWKTYVRHR